MNRSQPEGRSSSNFIYGNLEYRHASAYQYLMNKYRAGDPFAEAFVFIVGMFAFVAFGMLIPPLFSDQCRQYVPKIFLVLLKVLGVFTFPLGSLLTLEMLASRQSRRQFLERHKTNRVVKRLGKFSVLSGWRGIGWKTIKHNQWPEAFFVYDGNHSFVIQPLHDWAIEDLTKAECRQMLFRLKQVKADRIVKGKYTKRSSLLPYLDKN